MSSQDKRRCGAVPESVKRHFDGREMAMVHRMFRREFLLAPGVVQRVDETDSRRAHTVAAHLQLISATLHHHDCGEDRYVWPLLQSRAAAQISQHLAAVQEQHRGVETLVAQVDSELPIWSSCPSADSGQRLAAALERLAGALIEHMDYEEHYVVPLMETHIDLDEWNRLVRTMIGGQKRNRGDALSVLGMTMYECEKDLIDNTIARMAPDERAGIRDFAALAYASHAQLIHGTAAPPRSAEIPR